MTMIRRLIRASIEALGDDEVVVRMSTSALARDGHILVPAGCSLENYRANPILLWSHDPEFPVARATEVTVEPDSISARVTFAPPGISAKADEIRGLVKSRIINAVSVGFEILDCEPLDPKQPWGGQRITQWELLECSFVSVPADTGAIVVAREHRADGADWTVGAARDLPIEDSDTWNGGEAQASIFEWAGGDKFDPAKARKGFLVYNAADPDLRGSYKLPIAHAVDGELKVPKQAIRAAASRLPQTDLPDEVKDRAQSVLDGYKEKAGIGDDNGDDDKKRAARPARSGAVRGMFGIAQLAYAVDSLGFCKEAAEFETALEGDDSQVPELLHAAVQAACVALQAMTVEECAELVKGQEDDMALDPDGLVARILKAGAIRAGKTLSAASKAHLAEALAHHEAGLDHQRAAVKEHKRAAECIRGMLDDDGDNDDTDPQTASGSADSEGDENDRAARLKRVRQHIAASHV